MREIEKHPNPPLSVTKLSLEAFEDLKQLTRKEVELFGLELKDKVTHSSWLVTLCVASVGLLLFSAQILTIAFALYLFETQNLTLAQSFALTAGLLLALAAVGALWAWALLRTMNTEKLKLPTIISKPLKE